MSPNPTVIRQSEESEEDRSFWKVLILAVLGAGSVFLSFFLFDKFLAEGNLVRLLGSILFACVFLSFFVLQVFFTKSRIRIAVLSLIQVLAPLLFFFERIFPSPSIPLLVGIVVFFIFLLAAAGRGRQDIAGSLTIRFFQVAKGIMSRAVAGLLIAFSFQFYLTYFVWGGANESFSRQLVNQTLTASEPIVKIVIAEVSFDDTVDEFFLDIAEKQLRKIKIGSGGEEAAIDFDRLLPAEQEKITGEISLALHTQAEKIFGPLNADGKMNAEIFRIIKDYVDGIPPATKSVFSVVLAVLFFFSARGIAFLLYWLPELIAFLMFKLFMVTGFAYVGLESRSREFIMLS
ncbi:hypothetical protein A2116_00200 [Candidatus Jorgensenbacteria bacterium GWA1_49_17]|uniref:Uncharacterized protein n=1 Tax=Candidatus Jorgensenbacteria bacterium GWA1_49_17 TaxID=1798467 RepID=A0A1F6BU38_9BACT|nr:MAG: hypothetical protein A2116_00200 [Candidatus Jorgensenbacteria bacterium GWA1_49_17]